MVHKSYIMFSVGVGMLVYFLLDVWRVLGVEFLRCEVVFGQSERLGLAIGSALIVLGIFMIRSKKT